MDGNVNALRWDGRSGHYEVYYLTLTDPLTGVGAWIRYTMLAPARSSWGPASCSLWFLTMDPSASDSPLLGRKVTFPIERMRAQIDPFELLVGEAQLSDHGMRGGFEDVSWDLRWTPSSKPYAPVDPRLWRVGVAKTAFVLPHGDLAIDGQIVFGGRRIELAGARGGQAHLWGAKHARSWAWVHCNDMRTLEGEPVEGVFVDGVSAEVSRLGGAGAPNTPIVGRIDGEDFCSTSLLRLVTNRSTYTLTSWRFEAVDGSRKLVGDVHAGREQLAAVRYTDPDGEPAYCYNSETASLRLHLYERARQVGGWAHKQTLEAPGRAHFEYARRAPVPGIELLIP